MVAKKEHPSRSDFKSVESKREHSSLLPHTEPLKHFIDDILRRIFAGEVTEGIQRIVHTDRYGIQPKPAADRIIGDVREDGLAALIEELWFDGPKAEPSDRSFGSAWETMER